VQVPTWTSRSGAWWYRAAVVAGLVGVAGIVAADGAAARLEVAFLTALTVAGIVAKARWPGMPTLLLGICTFVPAIVLNLQKRGEGTMFLLVVALCYLVLETPDRRARLVAGVIAVMTPLAIQVVSPRDWGWPYWVMGIGFGWLSGEQMRRTGALVAELAATRELLAEQAVNVERRRIAAELHDLVGHSLTVVLLSVTGARRLVRENPDAATEALLEAEAVGRASLAEIRASVRALRDERTTGGGATAPMPVAGDVPDLVDRMVAAGSSVDLAVTGDLGAVEAVTGLVVYRVVQESLNNAARHAPGAPARVAVAVEADAVEVEVSDAGEPSDAPAGPSTGVGLIGMRERVEAVGGAFHAGPSPGGWRVRARVPRAGVDGA
jgi:signal transduction histidine kinase